MFALSTSKRYHHGDLRAALLESTRAVVGERGVEGLSLREVSRRAGVSHAAAYNHFREKGDLVRAFVDSAYATFLAELEAARNRAADPLDALLRIGLAYVLFAFDHQAEFRIMFRPELASAEGDDPCGPRGGSYALLVDAVILARAAGLIAGDVDALVLAAWSAVHGLAALIVDGPDPSFATTRADVEAKASAMLAVLVEGMRARGAYGDALVNASASRSRLNERKR